MRRSGILAAATLCALLVAASCGGDDGNAAAGTFTPKKAGVLTVVTSLPAPGFWDGPDVDHLTGGFEWGIANDLAKEFGLQVEFRNESFEEIAGGSFGDADVALAQISTTESRRKIMDFSSPYYPSNAGALARKDVALTDLAAAKALQWVVEESTTEESFLHDVIKPDDDPLVTQTRDETLKALGDGRADAALLDLPTALSTAHEHPELSVPAQFATNEQLAVALPKGSGNTEAVSSAIRALDANGTVDDLAEKYLLPTFSADPAHVRVILTPPED